MSAAVVLFAVIVVAVLVVIYHVARRKRARRDPREAYASSDGTFDEAAQEAVALVEGAPDPSAAENLLAATIITNDVVNREHRVETTAGGAPTAAARRRTRERRELFGRARGHLVAALDGARAGAPETPVILDTALTFAFGGLAGLLANDPLMYEEFNRGALAALFDDAAFVDGFGGGFGRVALFDAPVAARAGGLREQVIRERRDAAAGIGGGVPAAAVDAYVDLATTHVDDPQNVHDTSVLACQRAIVERLRADAAANLPTVDQIIAAIEREGPAWSAAVPGDPPRPARVADAVAAAQRTKEGERVVSLGASDEDCLRLVWARADDPRNAAVRDRMRAALFDGLVDCWEADGGAAGDGGAGRRLMCVNGRTSHILGSLAMLDHDARNWVIERTEHFKNNIFAAARSVIDAEARLAAASADDATARAGRLFLAKTPAEIAAIGDVPEAAAEQLTATMRASIGRTIDEYVAKLDTNLGTSGVVPRHIVESVKKEAEAAV